MPTNQLASEALPEGQWWHGNPHDCWGMKFYGNPDGGVAGGGGEMKQAMFEKALTPSDVGKLNRLVIPKQHAERYFPLESELSFQDEAGKLWRFRYSYWNSSQSYVLTKGWSRFVKDKTLHAGDIVSFHGDGDRLYIGWKRRRAAAAAAVETHDGCGGVARQPTSSPGGWGPPFNPGHLPYPNGTCIGGKAVDGNSPGPTTSKRLRLFGVNLDFPADEPNGSCWLSQGQTDAISFQRVQSSGSSSQS